MEFMASEAVVFPQYCCKDNYLYSLVAGGSDIDGAWSSHRYGFQAPEDKYSDVNNSNSFYEVMSNNTIEQSLHGTLDSSSSPSVLQNVKEQWDSHSSSPETCTATADQSLHGGANLSVPPSSAEATVSSAAGAMGGRKRRRTKSVKNKEEIESQRMTHIAVERNRRKQMNEYLAVLRSLMPPSYVQRGDQASIIGGAINFVKELEQLLQYMKGQKKTKKQEEEHNNDDDDFTTTTPFAEFFMFPQYSRRVTQCSNNTLYPTRSSDEVKNRSSWAAADIEVSLVDSHANMKILSENQPGLLLKMLVGLQSLGFTILHLNVATADHMILTSVSVKVEEGCQQNTVDEIAASVNQLLRTVHEEAAFSTD